MNLVTSCSSWFRVERLEKDSKRNLNVLLIRFYLQSGCARLNRVRKLLVERSKWYISRLMSMTSQLREFLALSSVKNIPLLPAILNPSDCSFNCRESGKYLSNLTEPLQRVLRLSCNDSQLLAISAAIRPVDLKKDFSLSLIQGPPGTGKTRTIVAIISALFAMFGKKVDRGSQNCGNTKLRVSQSAAIVRAWQNAALAKQIGKDVGKQYKSMGGCVGGRVLVCAQSNAAVDELVSRLSSTGLYGSDGTVYKPFFVRVGNAKTVHPSSLPFFIDTLVDHRLAEETNYVFGTKNEQKGDSSAVLRSNLEKLVHRIRFYEAKRANLTDGSSCSKNLLEDVSNEDDVTELSVAEIEARLRKLYGYKKAIYRDLSAAQVQEKKAVEESKALKRKLRKSILREAEIVMTTLSGCGGDLYEVCSESVLTRRFSSSSEDTLFDAVVIDEAAQALEPATLIPFQLLKSKGCKCIMVGDPKQLPATVMSKVVSKYLYQCSMFERLQRAGHPVTMLTKQYRMHPEISRFPSLHFYSGKLLNGDGMSTKEAPFHKMAGLGPFVFFDVMDGEELHDNKSGSVSLYNDGEADAAIEVLRFFKQSYPLEFVGGRIGIITPYKSQLLLLRSRFSCAFGSSVVDEVEFNTVDGFQGREVDIVILSTVRAAEASSGASRIDSGKIGFVADVRRMNVALTRARLSLWILGNVRTLQKNENWAALVNDAGERNLILSVRKPYSSMFMSHLKKRDSVGENFHSSRQLEPSKKLEEVRGHSEKRQKIRNISSEPRTKDAEIHCSSSISEGRHSLSSTKEAVKAHKKAKCHHLPPNKDNQCVDVGRSVKISPKGTKFAVAGKLAVHDGSWQMRGERKIKNGHVDVVLGSNTLNHSEQLMQDNCISKSVSSTGSMITSENDKLRNRDALRFEVNNQGAD